jgi:hypothetical protein
MVGGQSHASSALPLRKTRYSLCGRLGRPQGRCGWLRNISPLSGFDLRIVQPVASRGASVGNCLPQIPNGLTRYRTRTKHGEDLSLVVSSLLCDSILVEIKCISVRRNTTVFSNCWRNQLHVSALFWVGHHQVGTRISEETHIIRCGHFKTRSRSPILDVHIVVYEFSPIF